MPIMLTGMAVIGAFRVLPDDIIVNQELINLFGAVVLVAECVYLKDNESIEKKNSALK